MSTDFDAPQLITKLFQLQEERVHAYRLFEEGYKIYMSSGTNYNFIKFRKLVSGVTKDFKRISSGIIDVEKQLRFGGYSNIADLICLLQEEEERRLQICAKLQIAKQDASENPDLPEKWSSIVSLSEMYNNSIQKIDARLKDIRFKTEQLAF